MAEIDRAWEKIRPICACHGEQEIELTINDRGQHSLFYSCPKYYPQNREKGEVACNNRINLIDYEKMVTYLSEKIANGQLNGGNIDMTNHHWKSKGIEFSVVRHTPKEIVVAIKNRKAMR